ncbi:MAG: NAD-dependent epimerase/dehydratase family protein [Candidatus Kerfeldbacteria bacterium]|nr:NAD-dependent epimerase/dehydratase family protein [Candidatus Kerfeldbacteria bacterium]
MEHVLVTGGAGFIGSQLVENLLRTPCQVTVIDDLSSGQKRFVPKTAKFYKLDVRSPKLKALVKRLKPDYVCHLAAQLSVPRSIAEAAADASINIVGSLNVLEAVKNLSLKKFLFVSSAAVYGQAEIIPTPERASLKPGSPYALSKVTVEQYLSYYGAAYSLPYVVVRPANIYGPRQSATGEGGVVAVFCKKLLNQETLLIEGSGQQTRDFTYVTDLVQGLAAALWGGNGIYNLAAGKEVAIRELVLTLGEVMSQVPRVAYAPERLQDIKRSCLDTKRAASELGWKSNVPLLDGLRQTLRWQKSN